MILNQSQKNDEIDVLLYLSNIWKNKFTVIGVMLIFAVFSYLVSLTIEKKYVSSALLEPSLNENANFLSSFAKNFGAIGSLAGMSFGQRSADDSSAIAHLQSRKFILSFLEKEGYLPLLFPDRWDKSTNNWKKLGSFGWFKSEAFGGQETEGLNLSKNQKPTNGRVYKFFQKKIMRVNQDKKNRLVTISISTNNPELSADILTKIVKEFNKYISNERAIEATKNIEFINRQLEKTSVIEMQRILGEMIASNMQIVMLSETKDEFVFKTIDPAFIPERPAAPKKALFLLAGAILGLAISSIYVNVKK